ncbi:MAG: hypothetical protein ACRD0K_18365 [Egibacteraceae bacterium]
MNQTVIERGTNLATAAGALAALYAVSFFLGALLHAGVRIPLGFAVLAEPLIVPAVIVESLCGLALAIGAYAALTRQTWAWLAVFAAHAFALAGVLLGISAIAAGRGPHTVLNDTYHAVMVVLLVTGMAALSTRAARAALGAAGSSHGYPRTR